MALTVTTAPQKSTGIFWVGTDGNVYYKGAGGNSAGVSNLGSAKGNATTANLTLNGATQVADPNAPKNSGGGSTYSGGGAGNRHAPVDLSSYNQSINATNAQINDLTPTLNNELAGANDTYQSNVNNLLQGRASADKTYGDNKTADRQDYVTNKNAIRTNTGSTINGIDSLIGSHGGGGQAAGDYAALLAAKAGTGQLQGAGSTFGKNEQSLDTNYNNFLTGYKTNMTNAGLQRDSDISTAKANIDTQKANLLQTLASLINERTAASGGAGTHASQPYVNQAKSLLGEASSIGAPKAVAPITPTVYTAPALSTYITNPTAVSRGGASAATDSTQPFYATLLNRDKHLQAA